MINQDSLLECGPEGEELFRELINIEARCMRMIEQHNAAKLRDLEARHESLVVELQELEKRGRSLEAEKGNLTVQAGPVDSNYRNALRRLKETRAPDPARATRAQLLEHENNIEALQRRLSEAEGAQNRHNAQVAASNAARLAHSDKLQKLNEEIDGVWHTLEKLRGHKVGPRFSRETGLRIA